jgi:hypothetical protein
MYRLAAGVMLAGDVGSMVEPTVRYAIQLNRRLEFWYDYFRLIMSPG